MTSTCLCNMLSVYVSNRYGHYFLVIAFPLAPGVTEVQAKRAAKRMLYYTDYRRMPYQISVSQVTAPAGGKIYSIDVY